MKVIIINGSARKGNTLTAIEAFVKGASEKNEIEIIEPPTTIVPTFLFFNCNPRQ